MRMDAVKGIENVVSVSQYTEMEVEHAHDTANRIP